MVTEENLLSALLNEGRQGLLLAAAAILDHVFPQQSGRVKNSALFGEAGDLQLTEYACLDFMLRLGCPCTLHMHANNGARWCQVCLKAERIWIETR